MSSSILCYILILLTFTKEETHGLQQQLFSQPCRKLHSTSHHGTGIRLSIHHSTRSNEIEQASSSSSDLLLNNLDSSYVSQDFLQSNVAVIEQSATTVGLSSSYKTGLATIFLCTLGFSSISPVMHAALSGDVSGTPPPVLLLNAIVSCVAFASLLLGGPLLESIAPSPSSISDGLHTITTKYVKSDWRYNPWWGGLELGVWKSLGTIANLYGLSLTTADHGAFLVQLTTLIVPSVQGLMGVPIAKRIQCSIVLALIGVALFTQDTTGVVGPTDLDNTRLGDLFCVVAAGFYATYDLRLFRWGKRIAPRPLMEGKILVQALLSVAVLLVGVGVSESVALVTTEVTTWATPMIIGLILWSGVIVNMVVPFLQVGGQQAIGPSRAQTIYASQPLWAAILAFVWLHEQVGWQGLVGGSAFLVALFLAATTEPDGEVKME